TLPMSVFCFQAEDGIRDGHVTGVQTCALPIWPRHDAAGPALAGLDRLHRRREALSPRSGPRPRPPARGRLSRRLHLPLVGDAGRDRKSVVEGKGGGPGGGGAGEEEWWEADDNR